MFRFSDVIGQVQAKERLLREACEGRMPHAMLFCGPPGCGKLPLALACARWLCCSHHGEEESCGSCPSCVKWEKLSHPDVHFMFPIVKNVRGKKETCDDYLPEWRRLLTESAAYFAPEHWLAAMGAENGQPLIYARESDEMARKLSLKPGEGGCKVALVWLPEKMHEVCANKLLKLLEEPPGKTFFLLVSEAPEQILPTVLSRTQRFNLPPLGVEDVAGALQGRFGVTQADSDSIARMAGGNFVRALEEIHLSEENELFFNLFVSLMRLSYQRKIREMKQWSEQLAGMGRERQKNFLQYCQRMIRENFVYNLHCPQMNYMTAPERQFASRFAPFVNERNVMGIMQELAEAQLHVEQNVNARMVFFDFSLKMIVLLKS